MGEKIEGRYLGKIHISFQDLGSISTDKWQSFDYSQTLGYYSQIEGYLPIVWQ